MTDIPSQPCPRDPVFDRPGDICFADLSDRLFDVPGTWTMREHELMLWLDPRPLPQGVPMLYRNYFTHGSAPSPNALVLWLYRLAIGRLGYMRQRARLERMYLESGNGRRVLDVGCGDGTRLKLLRDSGWEVEGQEIDVAAAERARRHFGISVHVGELPDLPLQAGSFDAVISNHVLEHVPDPRALLERCRQLLKPGGCFILTTPNAGSWGRRRYGVYWYNLDPPRHLQIFTPAALRQLALDAGFTSIKVTTSAVRAQAVTRGSLDIQHGIPGRMAPLRNLRALWLQWVACWHHRHHPDSGEELILRAIR